MNFTHFDSTKNYLAAIVHPEVSKLLLTLNLNANRLNLSVII